LRQPKTTPIEKYLAHLDQIFQVEPIFKLIDSRIPELPKITSIIYPNIPEPGMITGLTYGLSLTTHSKWSYARPELIITVASKELVWGQVAGYIANQLRGDCPFGYGDIINFKEKISPDSEMDAFLIFAPSILEKEDYLQIDLGLDYQINLTGLYPIYSSEISKLNAWGLEKFWHHPNFDLYDVNRKIIE